jgi:hypothetical protein
MFDRGQHDQGYVRASEQCVKLLSLARVFNRDDPPDKSSLFVLDNR